MPLTAYPVVTFNNGATPGSDTAASGAGPAVPVVGTAAAHTGGVSSTTVTLTNTPDLSQVLADGSAVLWMATASGRQFSRITAADNVGKTVTVEDAFTIAAASAVSYAIGGQRATFDNASSRHVFADAKGGWTVVTQSPQSLASVSLPLSASGDINNGPIVLRGQAGGPPQVVSQSAANSNTINVTGNYWQLVNLQVVNGGANASKTAGAGVSVSGIAVLRNCVLGDPVARLFTGLTHTNNTLALFDCEVKFCLNYALNLLSNQTHTFMNVYVHDGATRAVNSFASGPYLFDECVIANNAGTAFFKASGIGASGTLMNCTIHGQTAGGDGLDLTSTAADSMNLMILGTNITGNAGVGLRGFNSGAVTSDAFKHLVDYNNFGIGATANLGGARGPGLSPGPHDLAVDPQYTNAPAGNFAVGLNLRAKGYPDATIPLGNGGSTTLSFVDIGAAQRPQPVGGGGVSRARLVDTF